jgi:thermostable 8-oxoguanine DNA glycosylase
MNASAPAARIPRVRGDWQPMWLAFQEAYAELAPPIQPASEPVVRRELLFCVLGGHGVAFEMGSSALEAVETLDVFNESHDPWALHDALVALLEQPRFRPPRRDGSLRRFRFPRRKAQLICAARGWLLGVGSLVDGLDQLACERERRAWLMGCPGLGPKSASWLLRNTGWANRLAIIDIHVARAMRDAGLLADNPWPGDYVQVEQLFLEWCDRLGAPPAVFDLFVWEWQRGSLHSRGQAVPMT